MYDSFYVIYYFFKELLFVIHILKTKETINVYLFGQITFTLIYRLKIFQSLINVLLYMTKKEA